YLVELEKRIFIFEMPLTVPIVALLSTLVKYIILFAESTIFNSISLGNWAVSMFIEGGINFVFAFPMMWISNKTISLLHREYYTL
ncbi:MAG: hypothetical protein QXV37_04040, partial [Candidatus Jordarchaeaceae archaeon]